MSLIRISFLLGCAVWSGAVAANDGAASSAPDDPFFDALPVVLAVSRLAQPLADAPGSVTVLDAEAIRRSGARDLAELLRTVPGFQVAQSSNGAPMAVYHGITDANPRGLQILVDGRSQYSPLFFGGVAWNLIDVALDDIDRIEVIRGSNSAAYGSNAFLGVVNVVTKSGADTPPLEARANQGNDGVADAFARLRWQAGETALRLSAERRHDHGLVSVNDSRRNDRVNLRADLPFGRSDELQLQAGVVDLELDAGDADDTRLPPRRIYATKDFVSAGWQRSADDGGGVALRYTHSRERYRDYFQASDAGLDALAASLGLPSPFLVAIDQNIRTRREELEVQHTVVPDQTTRLVWGAGTRRDAVRGNQFYGSGDTLRQEVSRLFGNFEWRPERWVFNLGATWEDDSLSDHSLAPRLSANYHLAVGQTLRFGVTRAHRIPTLAEARARTAYGAFDTGLIGRPFGVLPVEITRQASGGLRPEKIDVQELGYLGDFRAQHLLVDLRVFDERVRDRIVAVDLPLIAPNCELLGLAAGGCGSATDFLNGQEVKIRGLEYQLRWRPRAGTELTLNQTFIDLAAEASAAFRARDAAAARAAEQHMQHSAPRHASMLRWSERLPFGVDGAIVHYRYGRFQWTVDSAVGPFERTDLRLARALRLGDLRGELALVLQGVAGRRAEYRHRAAPGSSATVEPEYLRSRGWLSLSLAY